MIKDHSEIVANFFNKKNNYGFMLTIARDGEDPVRSIYHFDSAIEACEAYSRYTNWGFAKKYLTVRLYEPSGNIHEKILKRPPAGECSYIKQNYIKASKLLLSMKESLSKEQYSKLVEGFALIFSQDNIRFDSDRFFDDCDYCAVQ
jgi:hypothetical protein